MFSFYDGLHASPLQWEKEPALASHCPHLLCSPIPPQPQRRLQPLGPAWEGVGKMAFFNINLNCLEFSATTTEFSFLPPSRSSINTILSRNFPS